MNFVIFIYGFSIGFLILGTIFSIIFFIIICSTIRPLKSNVLQILINNTYLALVFSSITLFEAYLTSFLSNLNPPLLPTVSLCQIRVYLTCVGLAGVMYSFVLQALFRLFRIVFYQKKALRSLRVFSIAIIFQWIFIFLINLPYIFLNDIQYVSSEYRCAIPWTNPRAISMLIILTYIFPVNTIFSIYFYIMRYVRRTTNAMHNRLNAHERDIAVFKRIIYLITVLQILSIPFSILWILSFINGYKTVWSYYIQALSSSIDQIFTPVFLALATPQIRAKFKWRRRQIHPNVELRVRHRNTEEHSQSNREQRF